MIDHDCGLFACAVVNFKSGDGFCAKDYAHVAQNWLIDKWLSEHGAEHSGKPLPLMRGQSAQQRRHPPVWKGKGKGQS